MNFPTLADRPFDPDHPEWMDADPALSPELRGTLESLRRLNAWFGAYRMAEQWLLPLAARSRTLRWLDLACGLADIPVHLIPKMQAVGCDVAVTAVDFQPATLALAREHAGALPIQFKQGCLPEDAPETDYDLVTCFLALHHFSNADAHRLLSQLPHWGRRMVLVADLERSAAAVRAIDLLTATLFREPETRHDARLSIRQSFTFCELGDLAVLAGWSGFEQRRHWAFRQAICLC